MPRQPSNEPDATWQTVLELRSQREIVGRWLQTADVPEQLLAQLRLMLDEIETELTRWNRQNIRATSYKCARPVSWRDKEFPFLLSQFPPNDVMTHDANYRSARGVLADDAGGHEPAPQADHREPPTHELDDLVRTVAGNVYCAGAGLALLLGRILPLTTAEMAGLLPAGAAPGAPLMTRNIAKKGFDRQRAAGCQVWGGRLTPIMLPSEVWLAGLLYSVRNWIAPRDVLLQIAEKQFVPLLMAWCWRTFCQPAPPRRSRG